MSDNDAKQREARRDLDRLGQEGGLFSAPKLKARTRTLRGHFAAQDADPRDAMDVWGTRIGRGLAAVALAGLLLWLVLHLGR